MTDAVSTEYLLRIRLDKPVSDAALADEISGHIGPLIACRCICGDVIDRR
jgi:hypothetical protein